LKTLAKKHDILLLSRLQLFRNVDLLYPELYALLGECEYKKLAVGDVILSTDEENHYLYVLLKGRLVIKMAADDDLPLSIVEPGECIGEMCIIDSRAPSIEVSATEITTVLAIEREILWRMISISHEISRNLLYIMAERVRYSSLVIADSFEMQKKYQRYATTDALTGLRNRGWLDDAFEREIKRSERDMLPLSLIMIDIDDFKKYNDGFGHLAGDQVLKMVARCIRSPLRPNDLVARFGGEEFAVLLPETTLDHARIIAERLRNMVRDADPGKVEERVLPKVTISLGVASRKPGSTLESMISAADEAMYDAKHSGKNCVAIATDEQG
jgi:diguanylate cyclase (GGDEF)-like protein